jgi:1,4-dihydroxy-2-naphthoyl-CoA hydrolase
MELHMDVKNTLIEALDINFVEITEGRCVATMPVNEKTRQPFGILHGGASVALAETVASVGTYYMIDRETEGCAGLEINANHVKAKKDGVVKAIGTVLHKGKTTAVWDIKIVDEQDQLICVSRCTMAVLKLKK